MVLEKINLQEQNYAFVYFGMFLHYYLLFLFQIYNNKGRQLMEKDPQDQIFNSLKQDRQGVTPNDESWNDDNDSNDSLASEQIQQNKQIIVQGNENGQKKQNQNKMNKVQQLKNSQQFITLQHSVDPHYLILLIVLNSHNLIKTYQISGLKKGKIHLVGKQSKILVEAQSQKEAAQAIQKISDYIDKISLLKLGIKGQAAFAISRFKKLKNYLRKDKIVFFSANTKQGRQLFMGGQMKPTQLRANSQKIVQIKVAGFFLRNYANKRSYKLIIDAIMNSQFMQQAFSKFNLVQYTQIQYYNKAKELKIVVGSLSKKEITVYQYQNFMVKNIEKFYVLTFCFESEEKYLEKLKCDKVMFKFVKQKKFNRSYLYVIALREDFLAKSEEIMNEINKIGDKIIGVRLFKSIYPGLKDFLFDKNIYYLFRFPKQKPYSTVVTAFRKEGNVFDWKIIYNQAIVVLKRSLGLE